MRYNKQETQQLLVNEKSVLLNYFKSRFPLFHNSNIFFRDMQFVIQSFLELRKVHLTYSEYESITSDFLAQLENEGKVIKVSANGWKVNMPEFRTGGVPAPAQENAV